MSPTCLLKVTLVKVLSVLERGEILKGEFLFLQQKEDDMCLALKNVHFVSLLRTGEGAKEGEGEEKEKKKGREEEGKKRRKMVRGRKWGSGRCM